MGSPIEREGTVFSPDDMNFFNGELPPDDMLVRKFMAVDPAFGGGDYTAAPVVYQYSDGSIYVVDVVYDNGDKTITQKLIVDAIQTHGIQAVRFECNKMTMSYKEEVERSLAEKNIKINLMTKTAPNNQAKEMRIFDKAPLIRTFYFLDDNKRSKAYKTFMVNVYSFRVTGHNKHDDAPDSLAMAADFIERPASAKVEVFRRPW
jgi:predicted phage terminase large subunit-like protein